LKPGLWRIEPLPRREEASRESGISLKIDRVERSDVSERADKKHDSALWENIKVIIQALLLAMVIRTVFFQPFTIPSGSMMPTLLVGDYIFVNKFSYGYSKYSLPFSPDLFDGRLFGSEPDRGDVIVFRLPTDTNVDYIKRLIGLPGDRIQVRDGVLYVNDQAVPKQPNGTFTSDYRLDPGSDVPVYRETLENGVTYDTLDQVENSRGDNTREFIVPEGHYFFMGDNRDNSLDSRFDVGFVPAENLIGRASVIFFSLGNDTSFREFWNWPANMRWERMFKSVH
jgi:signal peptidase I